MREAQSTTVMSARSQSAFIAALGDPRYAEVLLSNLVNRIIFRTDDSLCAERNAEFLNRHAAPGTPPVTPIMLSDSVILPKFDAFLCTPTQSGRISLPHYCEEKDDDMDAEKRGREMPSRKNPINTLKKISFDDLPWSRSAFCKGWLITGGIGCGKGQAMLALMRRCFKHEHNWGGVVLDDGNGSAYESLVKAAKEAGREKDIVLLKVGNNDAGNTPSASPTFTINLLADDSIASAAYAAFICGAASVPGGKRDDKQAYFELQAQAWIERGISLFRALGKTPTLTDVLNLFSEEELLKGLLSDLEKRLKSSNPDAEKHAAIIEHFNENFLNSIARDTKDAIVCTIQSYLSYFSDPEVAEVFCNTAKAFDFADIEKGKIVCVETPPRLLLMRRFVNRFLKGLFYLHARKRCADKSATERNLLVLWQEDAAAYVSNEDGNVDVMREAQSTTVMGVHSQSSLIETFGGRDIAKTILANCKSRIIMKVDGEDCAQMSAVAIGTVGDSEDLIITPGELLAANLQPYHAIVKTDDPAGDEKGIVAKTVFKAEGKK